jgi:hypothetical protein
MVTQASRRAILHFGPPKTGTSALQVWCARNSEALARREIRYASVDNPGDPKHHWLLKELQNGRFDRLQAELSACAAGTLILSCEGVMVQRRSIRPESWAGFRQVMQGVDCSLFLVRRDPGPWTQSLWKQGAINPPKNGRIPVPSLETFARLPWLREMIALNDMAESLACDSGASDTHIAVFEADWFARFKALAGVREDGLSTLPQVHESPPEALVRLYFGLARSADDLEVLRQTLFAVYCTGFATTNVTLRNAARKFAKTPADIQARRIDTLLLAITRQPSATDLALVAGLVDAATALLVRLRR